MKKYLANLSDLELAGSLSHKLLIQRAESAEEQSPDTGKYLKFSLVEDEEKETAGDSSTKSELQEDSSLTFRSWDKLLSWCLSLSQAESVFVVDSQGFVITSWGKISKDGFEGMGAELRLAVEQLELIDPEAGSVRWIDLEFNKSKLMVFRMFPEDSKDFLFGFVTYKIPSSEDKLLLDKVISRNSSNLV